MTEQATQPRRVVMIHTVHNNEKVFGALADELLPGVQVEHVVDEALLKDTIAAGRLTDAVRAQFAERARAALASRPDAVLFTCSSVGPATEGLGVERIDTAMAERAVEMGDKIGVAATLPTTLGPTGDLVRDAARRAGKDVEVRAELAEGAFALLSTDPDEHDRRVRALLQRLAEWADVILLAQASMARATGGATSVQAPDGHAVPLLTSPRLGIERLARELGV